MCNFWQKSFCIAIAAFLVGSAKPTKEKQPMLVLDEEFTYEIPRNYRTTQDPYHTDKKFKKLPTRLGLNELKVASSAQFSEKTLNKVLQQLKGPVWIIDLRRESHGFVNGMPISWYMTRNDSNRGANSTTILEREKLQINELKNHNPLIIARILDKSGGTIHKSEPFSVEVKLLETEQELIKRLGVKYARLPIQDHHKPDDEMVDEFVDLVKNLPVDTWLYLHCRAGKGRSTTLLVLYDILRNGKQVSLEDILLRQKLIGGSNVFHMPNQPGSLWKTDIVKERKAFIEQFYRYATGGKGYPDKTWSEWLQINKA